MFRSFRKRALFLLLFPLFFSAAKGAQDVPSTAEGKPIYTLKNCINIALEQNPDILIARQKIEEAEGTRIQARAGLFPKVTATAGALHRQEDYATSNGDDSNRTQEDWNLNFRITQNVYSGGGVRNQFAFAKLNKKKSFLEYREVVEMVVMNVRIAFYEVLRNELDIEVRRQAVELLEEELKNQQSAYEAGTVPRLNVMRAEVGLANEIPALIEAENNYKNSLLKLSELMYVPYVIDEDDVPFEITGDLDYHPQDLQLKNCLAKAESLRPELQAKELNIQMQEHQVEASQSGHWPRVDVYAGYDLLNETSKTSKHDTVGGYIVGVTGTWNIFDGFATDGRVKMSQAQLASAYIARDAAEKKVQTEVRSAFLDLKKAETVVDSQIQNSVLAQESFMLAQASFQAGLTSQLDIMQARVDWTRARTNELKAKFEHKAALARLQRAISSEFKIFQSKQESSDSMPPDEEEVSEKAVQPVRPALELRTASLVPNYRSKPSLSLRNVLNAWIQESRLAEGKPPVEVGLLKN